jgi:hypothetical protein
VDDLQATLIVGGPGNTQKVRLGRRSFAFVLVKPGMHSPTKQACSAQPIHDAVMVVNTSGHF